MIDGGNGLTSWFLCFAKNKLTMIRGPLPLNPLVQLAESKVKSITESLRGIEQTEDPAENLRRLLLVRTAEILEGVAEAHGKKENRHD
jgi:hypothetical protein